MMVISSSVLFGANAGNTSASTGRLISPKLRWKRTYRKLWRDDSSEALQLIAPGGTTIFFSAFHCGMCLCGAGIYAWYIGGCAYGDIVRRMIASSGFYSYTIRRRV